MNRILSPVTNPTGWVAGAGTIYAIVQWAWTASGNKGTASPVVVAIALAVAALFTRFYVTPTADPKDAIGHPLAPLPEPVLAPPSSQGGSTTGGKMVSGGTSSTIVIPRQP